MATNPQTGQWQPDISAKQARILNNRSKYLLLSGPRRASKTIGGVTAVMWHLWRTPHARVSVIGRTLTVNLDGGTWCDLINAAEKWIDADFGMEWVTKPKMSGSTHKTIFEVTNMHGGKSMAQLDSLDIEIHAEKKFKSKRYSMIYMTELSNFEKPSSFHVLKECLRMEHLREDEHQLIGDTNPDPLGQDSWIWKLWWGVRNADDNGLAAMVDPRSEMEQPLRDARVKSLRMMRERLDVMEFTLDDNIWMTPEQKEMQKGEYAAQGKDVYERNVMGLWVKATREGIFQEVWRPNYHVVGGETILGGPEILLPTEKCSQLTTSWDIGRANNAAVIGERCFRIEKGKEIPVFQVLDEFVILKNNLPLDTLVDNMLELMSFWEKQCEGKIQWKHWSDNSSFVNYNNISDTYEYREVFRLSNKKIFLEAAVKGRGSVLQRVNLVKKLLFQNRLIVSARCQHVIEMFGMIKRGAGNAIIDPASQYKHVFDALTYWLVMECFQEMEDALNVRVGKETKPGLITVSL